MVYPGNQAHWHDKTGVLDRSLGKRFFITQRVAGDKPTTCIVKKPHVIDEGNGELYQALGVVCVLVVDLETKPVGIPGESEIG